MITCKEAGFFFIHIPKNGGSSIRDQIQPLDTFSGKFLGTKEHPELGIYDSSHVPLATLREYFPDVFETISSLDGYAIVRDPLDRFVSSIAQRFRQIHGKRPDALTREEVRAEVETVIAYLSNISGPLHHKFSHFLPQVAFLELDGVRMVDNVFPMDDIPGLLRALSSRLGTPLVEDFHSNKTVTFRFEWLARPTIAIKDMLKSRAPAPVVDRLRRVAMKVLTDSRVQALDEEVRTSGKVGDFIRTYYAKDFEIVRAVAEARKTPEEAL